VARQLYVGSFLLVLSLFLIAASIFNTMPAFIIENNTNTNNTAIHEADLVSVRHNDSMNSNGYLIAVQIFFSLLVFFIFAFCILTGIRKRRKARQQRQMVIEDAILQQERRYQLHLQGQCHSSSSIPTMMLFGSCIVCPPPSYSPPDPRHTLPEDAVMRLDHLLSRNQICTKPQ
jgi:hypothetical protein